MVAGNGHLLLCPGNLSGNFSDHCIHVTEPGYENLHHAQPETGDLLHQRQKFALVHLCKDAIVFRHHGRTPATGIDQRHLADNHPRPGNLDKLTRYADFDIPVDDDIHRAARRSFDKYLIVRLVRPRIGNTPNYIQDTCFHLFSTPGIACLIDPPLVRSLAIIRLIPDINDPFM